MSKLTILFVCAVALFSNVYAVSDEAKSAFMEAIKPLVEECSAAHGISKDDLNAAKEAHSPTGLKPCFLGCMLKKGKIMNDDGLLDTEAAITAIKKYVTEEEEIAKFAEIVKKCASVNDQTVSDGAEGCERAQLLVTCMHENKQGLDL